MMIPKHKRVILKGKALKELVEKVYDREHGCCAICGRYVDEGTKPHHVIFKSRGGGDTEDNLILLCFYCHQKVHHEGDNNKTQKDCVEYLRRLYEV